MAECTPKTSADRERRTGRGIGAVGDLGSHHDHGYCFHQASARPNHRRRGGFAGFEAARGLSRAAGDAAEIVLINPTNYFLYLPLLPEVAAGTLDPRRIAVSLARTLPNVRLVLARSSTWTSTRGP